MKKIVKYLAIMIVAIIISVTFYSTNKNNNIKIQNEKAIAKEQVIEIPCHFHLIFECVYFDNGGMIHIVSMAAFDD